MKVAFLSKINANQKLFGGLQESLRNYKAVMFSFPNDKIDIFRMYEEKIIGIKRIFLIIRNILTLRNYITSIKYEYYIINKISNYDIIFVDGSVLGILIKKIKRKNPNIIIIAFFHNVEFVQVSFYYQNKPLRKNIIRRAIFYNELWTVNYSDAFITLSNRDLAKIEELYNKKATAVIPVSFQDREIVFSRERLNLPLIALFLGSDFVPNIHGIKWFIENVLPYVNIKLKIIGKDIDKTNLPQNDKIEILGYVDDLEECMQNADFIVLPIFFGSGMKVKTCESLMHGKIIVGTHEAFEGYDLDFEKVGACCDTAKEFIKTINEIPKIFINKFNEYSRNIFLKKYSNDITFKLFKDVFEKCIIGRK